MSKFIKTLIAISLLAFGLLFDAAPGWSESNLRPLKAGVWVGAVRGNDQGVATSCKLYARKTNNEFWIILELDNAGLHVILYNKNWTLSSGDKYRSRVVIDDLFDSLVDATNIGTTAIDFLFGNDEPSMESIQAGRRISLTTQNGVKKFKLQDTRKAVDTLINCADTYLSATAKSSAPAARKADYGTGAAAYKNKDYAGALAVWLPLATDGHAKSQNGMGVLYYNGQGVPKNFARAAQWFQRAAVQGLGRAQNNLGEMYRDGEGVSQSDAKAVEWLRKAAMQGNQKAMDNMVKMITSGRSGTNPVGRAAITKENSLSLAGNFTRQDGRIILHPGDKINVRFTAAAGLHERSWVGFVADNAVDNPTPFHYSSTDLKSRTKGSLRLEVPRRVGDYRLWMYDAWNRKRLTGQRVRIQVDRARASLSLPGGPRLQPGQKFEVAFTELPDGSSYNWIAIIPAGTPEDVAKDDVRGMIGRVYLKNKARGRLTFTAPAKPGKYLLRMQDQEFATTLRDIELVVVDPAASAKTAPPKARGTTLDASAPAASQQGQNSVSKAASRDDISGLWSVMSGDFGAVTFDQVEDLVDGTFSSPDGLFQGEFANGTLKGLWASPKGTIGKACGFARLGSTNWGQIEATVSADGRTLTGAWGDCDGARIHAFSATRGGQAPAEPTIKETAKPVIPTPVRESEDQSSNPPAPTPAGSDASSPDTSRTQITADFYRDLLCTPEQIKKIAHLKPRGPITCETKSAIDFRNAPHDGNDYHCPAGLQTRFEIDNRGKRDFVVYGYSWRSDSCTTHNQALIKIYKAAGTQPPDCAEWRANGLKHAEDFGAWPDASYSSYQCITKNSDPVQIPLAPGSQVTALCSPSYLLISPSGQLENCNLTAPVDVPMPSGESVKCTGALQMTKTGSLISCKLEQPTEIKVTLPGSNEPAICITDSVDLFPSGTLVACNKFANPVTVKTPEMTVQCTGVRFASTGTSDYGEPHLQYCAFAGSGTVSDSAGKVLKCDEASGHNGIEFNQQGKISGPSYSNGCSE